MGLEPTTTGITNLPENWVIQWENLLALQDAKASQNALTIDTQLTNLLFHLRDKNGMPETGELAPLLATRNLLRGHRVNLPTGQANWLILLSVVKSRNSSLADSSG